MSMGTKGKVMRWLIQEESKGNNVVELFKASRSAMITAGR